MRIVERQASHENKKISLLYEKRLIMLKHNYLIHGL